jgi:Inositol polyphosphate kinase
LLTVSKAFKLRLRGHHSRETNSEHLRQNMHLRYLNNIVEKITVRTSAESATLHEKSFAIILMLLPMFGLAHLRMLNCNGKRDTYLNCENETVLLFDSGLQRFQSSSTLTGECTKDESAVLSSPLRIDETVDYSHQVAGHTCEVLRSFKGKVLKPMLKKRLFIRELRLYERMKQNRDSHSAVLPEAFVPNYSGLVLVQTGPISAQEEYFWQKYLRNALRNFLSLIFLPAEFQFLNQYLDKNLLPHLVLDDLATNYRSPCVIDIKMGQQTYEPNAKSSKKMREIKKCPHQVVTGFRITGMKVFDVTNGSYSTEDKQFGRSVTPSDATEALRRFFWNGVEIRLDVLLSVIRQLGEILIWFKRQKELHFYCSSILIVYDGSVAVSKEAILSMAELYTLDRNAIDTDLVKVKMIDFAHTLPSPVPQILDHGYILGISNLIDKLRQISSEC